MLVDAWIENSNSVPGIEATGRSENNSNSPDVQKKPIGDLTVRFEREKPIWNAARQRILEYMDTVSCLLIPLRLIEALEAEQSRVKESYATVPHQPITDLVLQRSPRIDSSTTMFIGHKRHLQH